MSPLRVLAVIVAAAVCALEAGALAARGGPGVVLVAPATRVAAVAAPPLPPTVAPGFWARMTSDDVARGVYGLSAETGALALSPEQRAAIGPLIAEGAELRARLGELRAARRAAREAWLAEGGRMVAVLGAERARAAVGGAP